MAPKRKPPVGGKGKDGEDEGNDDDGPDGGKDGGGKPGKGKGNDTGTDPCPHSLTRANVELHNRMGGLGCQGLGGEGGDGPEAAEVKQGGKGSRMGSEPDDDGRLASSSLPRTPGQTTESSGIERRVRESGTSESVVTLFPLTPPPSLPPPPLPWEL
jgi:hypothetical protein